ncbi:hypothetical protein F4818DRAFT_185775 [Hypoxylon cercidicola]|nr:hypothetical protein F4818DRAFT_185775 [Hypoxylon cercidicola]
MALLFCTAEEAKPFIPTIMSDRVFDLVESREIPGEGERFKRTLEEGATFRTDFIGASVEECETWTQELWQRTNLGEGFMIAIADKRTASDHTISLLYYNDNSDDMEFEEFEGGKLPAKNDTWYEFRIKYKDSFPIFAALSETEPDVVYPTYFGRKDECTDKDGIFDVEKAERLLVEQ